MQTEHLVWWPFVVVLIFLAFMGIVSYTVENLSDNDGPKIVSESNTILVIRDSAPIRSLLYPTPNSGLLLTSGLIALFAGILLFYKHPQPLVQSQAYLQPYVFALVGIVGACCIVGYMYGLLALSSTLVSLDKNTGVIKVQTTNVVSRSSHEKEYSLQDASSLEFAVNVKSTLGAYKSAGESYATYTFLLHTQDGQRVQLTGSDYASLYLGDSDASLLSARDTGEKIALFLNIPFDKQYTGDTDSLPDIAPGFLDK